MLSHSLTSSLHAAAPSMVAGDTRPRAEAPDSGHGVHAGWPHPQQQQGAGPGHRAAAGARRSQLLQVRLSLSLATEWPPSCCQHTCATACGAAPVVTKHGCDLAMAGLVTGHEWRMPHVTPAGGLRAAQPLRHAGPCRHPWGLCGCAPPGTVASCGEIVVTLLWLCCGTIQPVAGAGVMSACRELVSAVDYLHSNLIMHGDLKPDNLLLSADGRLTVSDFGSATVLVSPSQGLAEPWW